MKEFITNDNEEQLKSNFSLFLYKQEITLFKQRILQIVGDGVGIEILSRLGSDKVSPEKYLGSLDDPMKIDFDFSVFEIFLKEYISGKIKFDSIHININPITLQDSKFYTRIKKLFSKYGFEDFSKLSFEILENGEIYNIYLLNFNIGLLKSLGIQVGLDDYPNDNNNYELLGLIQKLDFIKIDKSFLLSLGKKSVSVIEKEIRGMIDDIRKIHPNIIIIIEGVESKEMYNLVINKLKGIDALQGYLFGKPNEI